MCGVASPAGHATEKPSLDLGTLVLCDTGIEFEGTIELPVLTEWSLVLNLQNETRFMGHVVVVACDPVVPGRWLVALYFIHVEEIGAEIQWLSA